MVTILDLDVAEQAFVNELLEQLAAKSPRNVRRAGYYDGKNAFRSLGMALPPAFLQLRTVLGWPAKAVDTLANRCKLEGFVWPGTDTSALDDIWESNRLSSEAPQAGVSSLIHAVSWLVTHQGDVEAGEPAALITAKDALSATAKWDARKRAISAFLSILATDDQGEPTSMALYLPDQIVSLNKGERGWDVQRRPHDLGRVPVEPLVYRPRLGRPFGSSRVSRAVMSMTDLAVRTVTRSEVTAELYSVPQRVILGASETQFTNADGTATDAWRLVFGRMLGLERDEQGEVPKIEQLAQASQEPHMAQLRHLAQLFAGETSIPLTSLGISAEANPASAEAYYASREDLISLAEATDDWWEPAWRRSMITALQIHEGVDDVPDEWWRMRARFRNPVHTSRAAAADAVTKMVATHPWMADSDTVLELYGFDPTTLSRLLADKRRSSARSTLDALMAAAGSSDAVES